MAVFTGAGGTVGQHAYAQANPAGPPQPDSGTANIGTVPITAPVSSGGYASPSVSFGPFGDTPWQDVPFRTFSVPQQVIQDQQAHTPYEMIRNDPSVGLNFSPLFSPAGSYTIRGFTVDDFDMKLDGLPIWTGSAVNGFSVAPEGLERVDVLTGAPSVLYGFAAPAGVINFITKKPLDTPLTNVTLQYNSRLNVEEAVDVSRRFGKDDQFGIRLNFAQQDGSGPIDHNSVDRTFFGLALDWKPIDGLKIWTNFQENYRNTRGTDPQYLITSAFKSIPNPPDLTKLYGQPWYYNRSTSLVGEGGLQYDKDDWHFAVSGGEVRTQIAQLYASNGGTRLTPGETYTVTGYYNPDVIQDGQSVNVQGSKKFTTGIVAQTVGLNYTWSKIVFEDRGYEVLNNLGTSSLLDPVAIPEPIFGISKSSSTFKQLETTSAFLITDRFDIGPYVTVVAGADVASVYNSLLFLGSPKTSEGQSQVTPLVALQVHPTPWITGYFSFIQALEIGSPAPAGSANFGSTLSPYVGNQYEVGVKANVNSRLQLGADLFRVEQQNGFLDPVDNVFKANGTAQSQGVEFTAAGQLTEQFKVLGGATILNAQVINPTVTTNATTKVQGVPDYRLTLIGQYAVAQVPGLSLLGGVYFTGAMPVTQSLSTTPFATFDIGSAYDFTLNNIPVTASFYVQNILNNRYWVSAAQGQLSVGTPLQASFALTMRF